MQGTDGSATQMPYANTSDFCLNIWATANKTTTSSSNAVKSAQGSARRLAGHPVVHMIPGSQRVVDSNGKDVVQPFAANGRNRRLLMNTTNSSPSPKRRVKQCPLNYNYDSISKKLMRVPSAACGGPGAANFKKRLAAQRSAAEALKQQCHVVVRPTPSGGTGGNNTAVHVQASSPKLQSPADGNTSGVLLPTRSGNQCNFPATPKSELDARIAARKKAKNGQVDTASLGQPADYWTKLTALAKAVVSVASLH